MTCPSRLVRVTMVLLKVHWMCAKALGESDCFLLALIPPMVLKFLSLNSECGVDVPGASASWHWCWYVVRAREGTSGDEHHDDIESQSSEQCFDESFA